MITSETIAKAAGVSRTVVSVVLSGKAKQRRIADATVEKVLAIAENMGYSPNLDAQSLRSGKNSSVGILMPTPKGDVYSTLIEGLSEAFDAQNYFPAFAFWKDEKSQINATNTILKRRPEGIITVEPGLIPQKSNIPAVSLFTRDRRFDCVTFDRPNIVEQAIDYLVGLGHTRIANPFVTVNDPIEEFREVSTFCRKKFTVKGITQRYLTDIAAGKFNSPDILEQQAAQIAGFITSFKVDERPTAIILYRDMLGAHLINALTQKGVKVPQDLSIISCDDSLFAGAMTPALTNFGDSDEQPLAKTLAERLFFRINSPDAPPENIRIKRKIQIRQSCVRRFPE